MYIFVFVVCEYISEHLVNCLSDDYEVFKKLMYVSKMYTSICYLQLSKKKKKGFVTYIIRIILIR